MKDPTYLFKKSQLKITNGVVKLQPIEHITDEAKQTNFPLVLIPRNHIF